MVRIPRHPRAFPRTPSTWLAIACIVFATVATVAAAQTPPPDLGSVRVSSSMHPELHVTTGRSDTYVVTLENSGSQDVRVAISQADFLVTEAGDVTIHPVDTVDTSNASWLEVASQVVVSAGGSATVPVALEVPADARPGTYWSLLVLEPSDTARRLDTETKAGVSTSITAKVRIGVSLITHVGPASEGALEFRDPDLRNPDGQAPSLSVTIGNPGAFLAAVDVWLEVYDGSGAVAHSVQSRRVRIYPGAGSRQTFELGALEDATYQAVVIADAGDERVYGVRYDLELGSD